MDLDNMTVRDCYERIYNWHKKYGKIKIKERYKRDNAYSKAYLNLIDNLPLPKEVNQEDMDFVFGEVIFMLMEWSFQEEDEYGIKIGTYALFALKKKYKNGFGDENFKESRESSRLFTKFGYPKWKDNYKNVR